MTIMKMTELDLNNKRVLIREDFNVPIKAGEITSDARIQAALFTIEHAHKAGAKIMLISHLGRPAEGGIDPACSLKPIATYLAKLLKHPVRFVEEWIDGVELKAGEIVVCENVRFLKGETSNDERLSKKMAALCDLYVMDAFGTAHRTHASTHGVARFAPMACAGPLLVAEWEALSNALENPQRPLVSIVGGAKVSTKVEVLKSVIKLSDYLIVGGGVANTFFAATGKEVGKSLCERDLLDNVRELLELASNEKSEIPFATDVVVATEISERAIATIKPIGEVKSDEMILDIGPESCAQIAEILKSAKTIIWNGPLGVFEYDQFSAGTRAVAEAIAQSKAFSIGGGGDTLAAIEKFNIADKVTYISTGGGAFLEFLENHKLPAVSILEQRALMG